MNPLLTLPVVCQFCGAGIFLRRDAWQVQIKTEVTVLRATRKDGAKSLTTKIAKLTLGSAEPEPGEN